ncbi:MAG: (E)-4-hydroxy-3-methylbut-2-enyl-diphosphate synthase [Acidobacteriota bacterium]|nr:(E)-4-hydroxy-3-methylbut-2-enyl-diphosphate synthase [Acidobacteriota bacterium]MDQ7087722.1 (E)-4-hydroxy-3-methylbut-2-enyl-diphosphate synthase [Acidobacteriota bacterium]
MGSDAALRLFPARCPAREVAIGDLTIGGGHPIAVQSMTTTPTSDAAATAAQVCALARAGCEIVRVTVPSGSDARALPEIRRRMRAEGVAVPLVADIHFTPRLSLDVIEHVEKVRINPGNFADRRSLKGEVYDESRWERDVERARSLFAPLARRARELGVALRIGVNHGSLSDRLVQRFGDSPEGMVESALEFITFAEEEGLRDLVISMKASIPQVMVRAYRLLARRLLQRGELYPLHLGVTEAGGGDDGRIKSTAGIATLLGEGLGDTVRVSLTEDPLEEIPVARELVARFGRPVAGEVDEVAVDIEECRDGLDPSRRETAELALGPALAIGGANVPAVELTLPATSAAGQLDVLESLEPGVEVVDLRAESVDDLVTALDVIPAGAEARWTWGVTLETGVAESMLADPALRGRVASTVGRVAVVAGLPAVDLPPLLERLAAELPRVPLLALARVEGAFDARAAERLGALAGEWAGRVPVLAAGVVAARAEDRLPAHRLLAAALDRAGARLPLVLTDRVEADEDLRLGPAGRLAPLLLDGQGDSLRLEWGPGHRAAALVDIAHRILQACRRRLERAEFIACPSCGRTLFDLEATTARVRELTGHLKLKIAVMGCVVNGPGEMADADYGYVGWGEGKVALFVGREMVEKDIPAAEAPARLVALIRSRGDWQDPA